jgi:adenosylhomocysteine nucleosidase
MSQAPVTAALLAALSQEVRPFLRQVQARRLPGAALPAWEFPLRSGKGVAVLSGVGPDAAARATAFILDHFQPQVFISLGFGGAVTPELPHGALVLGETVWRYEPESGSLEELMIPPSPIVPGDLVEKLQAAGLPAFRGSVVTTPVIIHKATQKSPLVHLPHPVLDLETGAAAAGARARNLPFLALRAITDTCEEDIPDFIRKAVREGNTPTAGTALAWLAADPRRLAALVRLWRHSRLAALNLAQALKVVLEIV